MPRLCHKTILLIFEQDVTFRPHKAIFKPFFEIGPELLELSIYTHGMVPSHSSSLLSFKPISSSANIFVIDSTQLHCHFFWFRLAVTSYVCISPFLLFYWLDFFCSMSHTFAMIYFKDEHNNQMVLRSLYSLWRSHKQKI